MNQEHQVTNQFSNLTEEELSQAFLLAANGPREAGNNFFNRFKYRYDLFSGNPAACLNEGLDLLGRCHSIDQRAYSVIHKGSIYYWIGMAAWLISDHEMATFFFDASVSEDIRAGHNPHDLISPSLRYMLLDGEFNEQAARDLVRANQVVMEELIGDYNARINLIPGVIPFTLDDLRDKFLRKSLSPGMENLRSLATTLISFCMEWSFRNSLFDIRPIQGTAEPFYLHLFKGCALFESLLKGNIMNPPPVNTTLGVSLHHLHSDLGIPNNLNIGNTDFPTVLGDLAWADETIQTAIIFTGRIRNTLGHNLGWVVNLEKAQYKRLFRMVSSSCLHAIAHLYP